MVTKDNSDKNNYDMYKKKLDKLIHAAKIRHYDKLLNMEFNSDKNVWKVLNNIHVCGKNAKGDSNINNISYNG